jgi:CMP-2-keto-3-deoxyoctulosonic acid synthetase
MLKCGDTFLTGDGDEDNFHLWIIITPPNEGEVVTVCVVTAHKRSERLVVLNKGDHPFVEHESVVAYRWSTIRAVDDIEAAFTARAAKQREPINPEILKTIQDRFLESDFPSYGIRQYFKTVMGL